MNVVGTGIIVDNSHLKTYAFFICPHCLKPEDEMYLRRDCSEIPDILYFNQKIMFVDRPSKTFKSKPIVLITNWKYNHCKIYHKVNTSLKLGDDPVTSEKENTKT